MSQRKKEKDIRVRFVGYAIGSQSERVLSKNSVISNDSAKKIQQNKRSLNQKKLIKKVTLKRFKLFKINSQKSR